MSGRARRREGVLCVALGGEDRWVAPGAVVVLRGDGPGLDSPDNLALAGAWQRGEWVEVRGPLRGARQRGRVVAVRAGDPCFFVLVLGEGAPVTEAGPLERALGASLDGVAPPVERQALAERVIRSTARGRELARAYQWRCQVCGRRTPLGPGALDFMAEVHYLRPLSPPHGGPDRKDNMLVLCPGHHALFDRGTMALSPQGILFCSRGDDLAHGRRLALRRHRLGREFLVYGWGLGLGHDCDDEDDCDHGN